jgi:hypothetical protein
MNNSGPLLSHGASYSPEPDGNGDYEGFDEYAIGPDGTSFRLYWRVSANTHPQVWNSAPGEYQIRNPSGVAVELWLHHRDSSPFTLGPGGSLRLDAQSIAAYMAAPRI